MNPTLASFLNHGQLPFIGRADEIGRIESFWRATAEAQQLRALLLVGEAGAGKSRLVDEAEAHITAQRGLVVHTKLYAESTTALAPLIATAIDRAASATSLIRSEPEGTLSGVASALRRLCRLRRTILIIEDIHLLARDPLQELSVLLSSLADDSLALLCVARPETIPARPLLEQFFLEEMQLRGLAREEVFALWGRLFGIDADEQTIDALLAATVGNMLAIRSALRGAIKRGAITIDRSGGTPRAHVGHAALGDAFSESVRTLVEGMAMHLEEDERKAAELVAQLGEVFARETAERIVDGALIDALVFKGIITRSASGVAPISSGPAGRLVLIFTHSLVHRYFLQAEAFDVEAFLEAVAAREPLYSLQPFHAIARAASLESIAPETLEAALRHMQKIVNALNRGPDWRLGPLVIDATERIVDALAATISRERLVNLRARILSSRFAVAARANDPAADEMREQLLALTRDPYDAETRRARLRALGQQQHWANRNARELYEPILAEGLALGEDPEVRRSLEYVTFLGSSMFSARGGNDEVGIKRCERLLAAVLADEETTEEVEIEAKLALGKVIDVFHSEDEYQRRTQLFEELCQLRQTDIASLTIHRAVMLYETGRIEEAWGAVDSIIQQLRDRGWQRSVAQCRVMRCCIRLVRGEAVELVDREITAIATEYPPDFGPMISSSLRTYASAAARLAGSDAFGRELSHRFARAGVDLEASRHALEEIERGTPERIDAARMREAFGEDADALLDTARPSDAVIAAFGRQLGAEIYRLESIIRVWLLLHLVERHDEPVRVALKSDLRSACARGLDWLKLRGLWSAASAHLKRAAGVMTAAERRRHERELALLVADNAGRRAVPETRRIRVSMLGTIEVVRPGAEPARPKGARLRQLLGVLSADAMLEHRLTNPEFYMLAAEEQDIDRARSTVYMAMHRLREMLGPGAIVTDAETPRFDRELVHVDIVEASARLHEARSAAREREWLRASTALLEAFELIGSEVAFPGLYDDFFEAAREDFEVLMRATAVRVGRGLLAEGDPENAEEVVRRALEAVPEDEELSELLTETLVALGRRTDAALLRRRRIAVE